MTDTDGFILAALQQSGCVAADIDASSWTTRELAFESLASVVSQCLARIEEADDSADFGLAVPFETPKGVAARHRLGSKLAGLLKELGYAGDCGYNHFLYPSEKDTRSILSWLVGKLPRAKQEEDGLAITGSVLSTPSQSLRLKDEDDLMLAVPDVDFDGPAAEVTSAAVASIFSAWKRKRTSHLLPSRHVRDIRGHQCLPLRTEPVALPWAHAEQQGEPRRTGSLFDAFPPDAVRVTSLLEALSAHKARGRASEIDNSFLIDGDSIIGDLDYLGKAEHDSNAPQTPRLLSGAADLSAESFGVPSIGAETDAQTPESTSAVPEAAHASGSVQSGAEALDVSASSSLVEASKESVEDEIELLQTQTEKTQRRIAAMRKVITKDRIQLQQAHQHISEIESAQPALEKTLATEKKLLAMLPAAEENVGKLEALCAKSQQKLEELALEWQKTRDPLIREQEELIASAGQSGVQARGRQLIAEMKSFRAEIQEMAGTIQDKAQTLQTLERAYASAQASNKSHQNRNSYTARIMDIIKQVHKQKQEIAKIIDDITAMQKQLNASAEKLKRSEAVAEDKLFSAATKKLTSSSSGMGIAVSVGFSAGRELAASPAAYVECYRKFTQVRELFEELLAVIGDVGKKENGVRDLHNWIAQLKVRDSSRHVDKVLADLQAVRLENTALHDRLRSASMGTSAGASAE